MNILWGYAGIPTFGHAAFFGLRRLCLRHPHHPRRHLQLLAESAAGHAPHRGCWPRCWASRPSACTAWGQAAQPHLLPAGHSRLRGAAGPGGHRRASLTPAARPVWPASLYPQLDLLGITINLAERSTSWSSFVVVICLFLIYRLVNSHYGYALRGIHDNERRMQALGYNTWLYKYTPYIIAAVFGGHRRRALRLLRRVMVPGTWAWHDRHRLPHRHHGQRLHFLGPLVAVSSMSGSSTWPASTCLNAGRSSLVRHLRLH